MKPVIIATFLTFILAGCSTPQPFYYKNGTAAEIITCSSHTWLPCLKSASTVCGEEGYEVLEKTSNKVSGLFTNSDYKEMIIVCKNKKLNDKSREEKLEKTPAEKLSTAKENVGPVSSGNNTGTTDQMPKVVIDSVAPVDSTNNENEKELKTELKKE